MTCRQIKVAYRRLTDVDVTAHVRVAKAEAEHHPALVRSTPDSGPRAYPVAQHFVSFGKPRSASLSLFGGIGKSASPSIPGLR